MVRGFQSFKEWFLGYEDQYTVIGGVACDLLMENAGQEFGATKDLDMVLMVEALTPGFVSKFWEYIREAGYEHQNKSTGNVQFYRFTNPKDRSWLYMIELFSRKPDEVFLSGEPVLTPIPVEEEISSLSAILLDETYYAFLSDGRIVIDGVPVLEVKHLIPFKAKAYIDNVMRKENGGQIDSKNIRKHKNDVFRLLLMLSDNETELLLPEAIRKDMLLFVSMMTDEQVDVKALGGGRLTKKPACQI
ncbi:hypothetical protein CXIVA_12700 [Clostridium sp. SY8519]|uniref:hypothetical protein n=1 Tax=Clostridium sp. (strain SY8519) TaxID=1042156 RepID=UPI0002171EA9|nr:hypothetical protein [Clostridium sp. SY8519]BAK47236.1 hypothetical protein CXIVA_12700 [Clostridium sp. SY8519]